MKNITGPPVVGQDFFGREKELTYVWKKIKDGNNIILPSPRRVGKTSFALKQIEFAKAEGWDTIVLNLEKVATEQDFLFAFADELKKLSWWSTLKDKGTAFLDAIKALKPTFGYADASITLEWEKSKENIYKLLSELIDHQKPTLIFFDELTILLTAIVNSNKELGVLQATNFLHWMRDIRIHATSRVRWIFCSSVGIENFTYRHKISDTLNDTHEYELKSYSKEESIKMLMKLAQSNNVKVDEQIAATLVEQLDFCLPFFLQISFEKIDELTSIENEPMDTTIVEKAFSALTNENHFNTWIERITSQYDANAPYALTLLKQLCQVKEGVNRENIIDALEASKPNQENTEEIVSELLYMLKNDGYLMEESRRYRFRSPLLREFWFNRFVK